MISQQVMQHYGRIFRGVLHMPINVCSHCGEEDDPETTRHWPEDEDGDRICRTCEEKMNGGGMKADWKTIYREGDIASRAAQIVGEFWVKAKTGSEGEAVLESVREYLHDRTIIAFEFSLIPIRQKEEKQAA